MPAALVLAAVLAWSSPAAASEDFPDRIHSAAVYDIEGDLERIGTDPALFRLKLLNRNSWAVRVDYSLETKPGVFGPVCSVILRNRGNNDDYRNRKGWDRAEILLPTGSDYRSFKYLAVVRGTVKERFGVRAKSDGTSEQYTELEFTEGLPDAASERGKVPTRR